MRENDLAPDDLGLDRLLFGWPWNYDYGLVRWDARIGKLWFVSVMA